MASVTTTLTNICSGGNHLTLTVQYGARTKTLRMERDTLVDDLSDDDIETWCRIIAKLVRQGKTNAQAAAALQAGVTVSV